MRRRLTCLIHWWMIAVLGFVLIGLLFLFILLVRTRSEMARKVAARTAGVLKGVTRRLGAAPARTPGKLIIIKGVSKGSTNGMRVNGMPISANQRVVLQPDAIIEVGRTRLRFKRLGGTTRQLLSRSKVGLSPGIPPVGPPRPPGQVQPSSPPPQPTRPREVIQDPPGSDPYQRGGPTRQGDEATG